MATLQDLKPSWRKFVEDYKYPELGPPAFIRLEKKLSDCKAMLVTTAGLHLKTDKSFSRDFRQSDCSFREIPAWARWQDLAVTHTSDAFNRSGIKLDLNVAYPIDRLCELERQGIIGSVAKTHYSFMGSLPKVKELMQNTAPELASKAIKAHVDFALLAPVCPMCNQTASLVARALEEVGISTVTISLLREVTEKIKPPRTLEVPYDFGFPLGKPNDSKLQHKILETVLKMLTEIKEPGTVWQFEDNA